MELGEDEVWRLAPDEIWRITQSARRLPTAPVLANRRPTDPSATGSAASSAEAEAMLPTGPIPPVPKAQPPLLHVLSSQSTISSSSVSPSPRPDHVDVKDVQRSTLDVADGLVGRCAVAVVGGAAGAGTHNCPPGAAPKGANGLKMTWSMAIGKWQESPDLPVRQANSTSSSTGPDDDSSLDEATGDGACGAGGVGSSGGVSSSGSAVGIHITLRGCFRAGYALDDCAPALKRAARQTRRSVHRSERRRKRPERRRTRRLWRRRRAAACCTLWSPTAGCGSRPTRAHTRVSRSAQLSLAVARQSCGFRRATSSCIRTSSAAQRDGSAGRARSACASHARRFGCARRAFRSGSSLRLSPDGDRAIRSSRTRTRVPRAWALAGG